ncbi:NRDE-2, necessary for RNA interference domain-containing protein [Ditylenchus destructor]|uniref:NRDE-2, necessary for RNA interference domain-containing protein n=1 Tax=Ditylenchus destructor TaxID=166010 RepID=A0AAD4NAL3_9BILA|nr:NRDE-2, necessary for RNA interference domain-containing protein [Ditylenchus destructor]
MVKECWRPVKDNPYDFDSWTRLLKLVEKVDDIKYAREAFDSFLKRYPYCYGYWKKYAELERQHKHYEKCLTVYERGLEAILLSVDLWLSYIAYVKEIAQGQRQAASKIRDVYMRALEGCGLEFRSDKLWEEYVEWEIQNGEIEKAAVLYDVMIITPTIGYASHFEKYKHFVHSYEPDKILSQEEYDEITDMVHNNIKDQLDGGPMFFVEEFEEDNVPVDGENYEEVPKKIIRQRKHVDIALKAIRDEILERRQKRYLDNEREVAARWVYESAIKRPYFHVKPLEREQVKNWYDYLDFEIRQKKKSRIQFLFDRCMIACALYDDLWIKYATYLESVNDEESARNIYKKASSIFVPRKAGIHLAFSAFEEKHGNIEAAQAILDAFDRRHPNYTAITLRQLAIERRQQMKEENPDYSPIVAKYERLIQDSSVSRKVASFYSLKLARFHAKIRHDRKLAKKIIKEAISRDKENLQLYLQLVDLAYNASTSESRDREVISALDFALDSRDLSEEDRFQFSLRKLEYLEELCADVNLLQEHMVQHLALEKQMSTPNATIFSGKRAPLNREPTDVAKAIISSAVADQPAIVAAPQQAVVPVAAAVNSVVAPVGYSPANIQQTYAAYQTQGLPQPQQYSGDMANNAAMIQNQYSAGIANGSGVSNNIVPLS